MLGLRPLGGAAISSLAEYGIPATLYVGAAFIDVNSLFASFSAAGTLTPPPLSVELGAAEEVLSAAARAAAEILVVDVGVSTPTARVLQSTGLFSPLWITSDALF